MKFLNSMKSEFRARANNAHSVRPGAIALCGACLGPWLCCMARSKVIDRGAECGLYVCARALVPQAMIVFPPMVRKNSVSNRGPSMPWCDGQENTVGETGKIRSTLLFVWPSSKKLINPHVTIDLCKQLPGSRCLNNGGSWRATAWVWPWGKQLKICLGATWSMFVLVFGFWFVILPHS